MMMLVKTMTMAMVMMTMTMAMIIIAKVKVEEIPVEYAWVEKQNESRWGEILREKHLEMPKQ